MDQQPAKNFDDVEETDQSDMESMEAREKEGSEIENDLNQSSSTDLVNVHASNEVIVIHSCESPYQGLAPFCWSIKQQDYFTCTYPGIIGLNGKIGRRECREVNTLKLHAEQESHISKEWIRWNVFPCKTKSREKSPAQKYLRKKSSTMPIATHT